MHWVCTARAQPPECLRPCAACQPSSNQLICHLTLPSPFALLVSCSQLLNLAPPPYRAPAPPSARRDFFLTPSNYASCRSPLVQRFGELLRKMWNTRNFKGQVRWRACACVCVCVCMC